MEEEKKRKRKAKWIALRESLYEAKNASNSANRSNAKEERKNFSPTNAQAWSEQSPKADITALSTKSTPESLKMDQNNQWERIQPPWGKAKDSSIDQASNAGTSTWNKGYIKRTSWAKNSNYEKKKQTTESIVSGERSVSAWASGNTNVNKSFKPQSEGTKFHSYRNLEKDETKDSFYQEGSLISKKNTSTPINYNPINKTYNQDRERAQSTESDKLSERNVNAINGVNDLLSNDTFTHMKKNTQHATTEKKVKYNNPHINEEQDAELYTSGTANDQATKFIDTNVLIEDTRRDDHANASNHDNLRFHSEDKSHIESNITQSKPILYSDGIVLVSGLQITKESKNENSHSSLSVPWPGRVLGTTEFDELERKIGKKIKDHSVYVCIYFPPPGLHASNPKLSPWRKIVCVHKSQLQLFTLKEKERIEDKIASGMGSSSILLSLFWRSWNVASGLRWWASGTSIQAQKKSQNIHHQVIDYGAVSAVEKEKWMEISKSEDPETLAKMLQNHKIAFFLDEYDSSRSCRTLETRDGSRNKSN